MKFLQHRHEPWMIRTTEDGIRYCSACGTVEKPGWGPGWPEPVEDLDTHIVVRPAPPEPFSIEQAKSLAFGARVALTGEDLGAGGDVALDLLDQLVSYLEESE